METLRIDILYDEFQSLLVIVSALTYILKPFMYTFQALLQDFNCFTMTLSEALKK